MHTTIQTAPPSTVTARQIRLQSLKVRYGHSPVQRHEKCPVELLYGEALPASGFTPVPESDYIRKRYVVQFIPAREVQQDEGDSLLLLKGAHEFDLVFMDIVQRECISEGFLRVKTDRYSLNDANVVDGTLLVKICQCDMPGLFVYRERLDRCWDFLD